MPKLISDYDIKLGVLAMEGAFTIMPAIGASGSRKGLLRFTLDCEQPAFIEPMYRTATSFARRNRGKVVPRSGGRARATFLLAFDVQPRDSGFGDLYANLAVQLFQEVRSAFLAWQIEHHLRSAVTVAALQPAERGRLRLVRQGSHRITK